MEENPLNAPGASSEKTAQAKTRDERPALIINIQSWTTPIVGVVMLIVGLLLGYTISPATVGRFGKTANLPSASATKSATQAAGSTNAAPVIMTSEPTADLMEYLVGQTRHFKGEANAPVTIIEFSDYQ